MSDLASDINPEADHANTVVGDEKACGLDPDAENKASGQDPEATSYEEYLHFPPNVGNGALYAEQCVNTDVEETIKNYLAEIEKKEKEIEKLKMKISQMQPQNDAVKKIFNGDQIYKLLHPKTTAKWSQLTVEQCMMMYLRIGTTGYNFLIQKGYPLVCISVIQKHLRKIDCQPGIQYEVIKVMAKKVEMMPEHTRKSGMFPDEFDLQAKKEYDCSTGTIIGAPTIPPSDKVLENRAKKASFKPENLMAQKCFNVTLGGLLDRWSQLVYYQFTERSFNKKVVATELKELITILQSIKVDVMVFSSDMGLMGL